MASTVAEPAAVAGDGGRVRGRRRVAAGVVAVLAVLVVLGLARWTGQAPFGSDNDEYRLVARQLLHLDAPVVAGVEGTKYPLGYPAVLAAIDAVGLPVVDTALVLNVVLLGAAAMLAALAVRHRGVAAAMVAGGVVLVCRPLWDATQSTMPDVALTAVVAGVFAVGVRRRALAFTLLAVVATALKSVGLLLGLAASAALLWRSSDATRRWTAKERGWWGPGVAALGVTGATSVLVGRYAEHTTGYARTFWLADPYDASAGDAGLLDVVARLWNRLDLVLDDATRALWGELVHGPPGWALTAALVGAGVHAARDRVLAGAFVVLDLAALAVWPYSSVRFGLPLVPLAAIGAGAIAARLRVPPAGAIAATAALVALAVPTFTREAHREGDLYAELDDARAEVVSYLLEHDAVPVSPDYRELATALPSGEAVLPLAYTRDRDALLEQATRGTHLVVLRGLYGQREETVALLLAAHGDRFEPVHANERFDVYRVVGD